MIAIKFIVQIAETICWFIAFAIILSIWLFITSMPIAKKTIKTEKPCLVDSNKTKQAFCNFQHVEIP